MNRVLQRIVDLSRQLPLQRATLNRSIGRPYRTDHGVYGFRPRTKPPGHSAVKNENVIENSNLYRLVTAYREHGHKKAQVDPLGLQQPRSTVELDLDQYGLSTSTADQYSTDGIIQMGQDRASLADIVQHLENIYCGPIAVEFQHVQSAEEREWFSARYEELQLESLTDAEKIHHARLMLKSQAWDHFLSNKFSTVKRYGGEGAESAMCFYDELMRLSANGGVEDIIICIAHRGRLNLLTCLLEFPPELMFRKMRGLREFPDGVVGSGDVLSHLTSSVDLDYDNNKVHVTMVPNPSHLEAANPVAVGKARAREMSKKVGHYSNEGLDGSEHKALCFQIHGDAAFAGQGVVAETFTLTDVPHYTVGGSIHLIVNNQIGFTTPAERGRSSFYSSCIGKMNAHPVIHVNGDHPEAVVKACRLAMEYRQKFHRDILVDLVCYRKWGHNEVDDPSFTQPQMYDAIRSRPNVPDAYAQQLVSAGICKEEDLNSIVAEWTAELGKKMAQTESYVPKANHLERQWAGLQQPSSQITTWDTGVPLDVLKFVGAKSVTVPDDMNVHPTLRKSHLNRRLDRLQSGMDIDWATAESMAVGTLLHSGHNVRISGQDVGRGTFSHRHWMLVDQETDSGYVPLNHMFPEQDGQLEVCNSVLSEEAVLGFEYGMSIETPRLLAIWEAQFGDFFNGAQIMIDTFVTCGETKWLLQSSLVMLLPHGMDGAGPEHSSCRMERFLQNTDSKEDGIDGDDVNFQIVNPTTPAQYFHLLRRQMIRPYRKPLVIIAPKVLLRHPNATSTLTDMASGTSFQPVLPDPAVDPAKVKKVVFVTGRLYYLLAKERETRQVQDMAIIRLEELCPFPAEAIQKQLALYKNAKDFVWSQEEHRNMGAWNFVAPRFENITGTKLRYVGRAVHATSAVGVGEVHRKEAQDLIDATFA